MQFGLLAAEAQEGFGFTELFCLAQGLIFIANGAYRFAVLLQALVKGFGNINSGIGSGIGELRQRYAYYRQVLVYLLL